MAVRFVCFRTVRAFIIRDVRPFFHAISFAVFMFIALVGYFCPAFLWAYAVVAPVHSRRM